jgi:hypothetical protein
MNVDREVIFDLLPLCEAGLASPASRRLVEDWLREHGGGETLAGARELAPDAGMEALLRAKTLLRRQRWLFGGAIGLTALCFSLEISFRGGLPAVRLLAFDYPLAFLPVAAGAALLWFLYFRLKARLR